jgi:heme exporter protein A
MSLADRPSPSTRPSRGFAGSGLACRRGERLVFARLGFTLTPGGALILVGPNGSGKSSLLRVMAGLTPAARGTLSWDGTDITEDREAHRARLHFIGHADALKPVLSAVETLHFWAGMRTGSAEGAPAEITAVLAQFGLGAAAQLPCRYLSAGQKRRLALARLVASPAPLWLLDEPLTGLDTEASTQLLDAIATHRREGGCVVVSTHAPLDLVDAAQLSLADFRPTPQDMAAEIAA